MDHKIRALTKGISNVRILDVTDNDQASFLHAINSLRPKAPFLEGHHAPSTAATGSLTPIHLHELQKDHRHIGKIFTVKIDKVEYKNGVVLTGIDAHESEDAKVVVWSLLLRPLGRELQPGMQLAVHEPYFGQCPSGEVAICLHHPSDCRIIPDTPATAGLSDDGSWSQSGSGMPISIMPRLCGIEVRPSPLGGRGLFATEALNCGDLLLCDKPLALCTVSDASAYGNGIAGILSGRFTNARKLALLQQLVDKVVPNGLLRKNLFELHADTYAADPELFATGQDIFNSYTALSIIKNNAHTIFPGNTSDHHDLADRLTGDERLTTADQRPGLWLEASITNHDCLSNASWSWLGDLFVMRANRDIAADEEVTIAYVPSSYPLEKRKSTLQAANGFECRCALCIVDSSVTRTEGAQEALSKAQRLRSLVNGVGDHAKSIETATRLVRDALAYYPLDTYSDLPCPQLAEPLFRLGQIILAIYPKGRWATAAADHKDKARDSFAACLEVGLGYNLVFHPSPGEAHCELLTLAHSQSRPVGILALLALAELVFATGGYVNRVRCAALKAFAKKMYGICYGEDRSFAQHHQYYSCKEVDHQESYPVKRTQEQWAETKEKARREKRSWPKWLMDG